MTVNHHLTRPPQRREPAREDQLAWKIAEVAADPVEVDADVAEMVINRSSTTPRWPSPR